MKRHWGVAIAVGLCLLNSKPPVNAAVQNKYIASHFRWKVSQTEHFDIYYLPGTEKIVESAAKILEKAHPRQTQALGIKIPKRSSFFLFMNHNQFEQNNVVEVGEGTGGVTEAFKDRFLVFNDGSQNWLEHVILHEFTHVCQFKVLYDGFWRSVRLIKSVLYPLWFMEGMAEYYSAYRDEPQEEMVIRDAVTSNTFIPLRMLHGFNHVKPHQVTLAYKTGNAALSYIAREYGQDKIGVMLNIISEKFDINSVLHETCGLSLAELDEKFKEDLDEKYEEEAKSLHEPSFYGEALTQLDHVYPVFNSNPAFFPDGKSFAFISDRGGYDEIYRYDYETKSAVSLDLQRRFPHKVEVIHRDGSALSVSPDGRWVLFGGESKEKDFLYLYDAKRDRLNPLRFNLDGVKSPQFSPDGKRIAFIGMKGGLNDIYTCDLNGRDLKQFTDTFADENDIRFFPDGKSLIFSRENPSDKDAGEFQRDLWTLSLDTKKEKRITSMPGNETHPSIDSTGKNIVFVGDETNRFEIYKMKLGEAPIQITRSLGGCFNPLFIPGENRFLFVAFREGQQQIYQSPSGEPLASKETLDHPYPNQVKPKINAAEFEAPASTAPLISEMGRKYKFRASTDFFFPVFFYSSTDGLFLSAYWQASEMLGNHQIQAAVTYASALNFLNYQILYSYLKFRPQFFLGLLGDTQENVFVTTRDQRREEAQFVGVTYPLSRFDSLTARLLTTQRRVQFTDDPQVTYRATGRENVASLQFLRDVSQGRYLETTSGYRTMVQYMETNDSFGSTLDYRNVLLNYEQFVPAPTEGSVAFRAYGGASFGSDRQYFRVGGSDLLRGYGQFDIENSASRFAMANLEYRFPIVLNANVHVWFFFPDFLFKSVYGHIFTDTGLLWNTAGEFRSRQFNDAKHSIGLGLRFQAFVLQSFPVSIQLDYARRTLDGEQIFYLGFGPHF